MSDLYMLFSHTKEFVQDKQKQFQQRQAQEAHRRRFQDRNNALLHDIAFEVTYIALDKLTEQYNLARAAVEGIKPLGICGGDYSQ